MQVMLGVACCACRLAHGRCAASAFRSISCRCRWRWPAPFNCNWRTIATQAGFTLSAAACGLTLSTVLATSHCDLLHHEPEARADVAAGGAGVSLDAGRGRGADHDADLRSRHQHQHGRGHHRFVLSDAGEHDAGAAERRSQRGRTAPRLWRVALAAAPVWCGFPLRCRTCSPDFGWRDRARSSGRCCRNGSPAPRGSAISFSNSGEMRETELLVGRGAHLGHRCA